MVLNGNNTDVQEIKASNTYCMDSWEEMLNFLIMVKQSIMKSLKKWLRFVKAHGRVLKKKAMRLSWYIESGILSDRNWTL